MAKKKYHELFCGIQCNEDQIKFRDAILDDSNQVILCDAVAGAGKTLIAVACAKQLVQNNPEEYDGAIYVFPISQESVLGYRPGSTSEKESDYLEPLYDALIKCGDVPYRAITSDITVKNSTAWITARSATFMRGINFDKKVIIIDECQNMSAQIIKRIISRAHDSCRIIVLGCQAQTDIPISQSGFKQLMEHMKEYPGYVKCDLSTSYRGRLAMHIDKL